MMNRALDRPMNVLIVGASQGIGLGFVQQMLEDDRIGQIYGTYRDPTSALLTLNHPKLHCISLDITDETQIAALTQTIQAKTPQLHWVINCVGSLHTEQFQPEKSLRQISVQQLTHYFQVNSIGALLLAKHLQPLFKHGDRVVFAHISAKVGSIGDNGLGGWYGYRASKAALNMFMRNVAIEYKRSCPRAIVALLHPGTTDTQLSKPFQANVPAEKLFSIDRTARQLMQVMENLQESDSGSFFSWDGSQIPW
jgi:NAD(P)-dependent dehydrogenase (short-subunit alcohol dehydrogenase family)